MRESAFVAWTDSAIHARIGILGINSPSNTLRGRFTTSITLCVCATQTHNICYYILSCTHYNHVTKRWFDGQPASERAHRVIERSGGERDLVANKQSEHFMHIHQAFWMIFCVCVRSNSCSFSHSLANMYTSYMARCFRKTENINKNAHNKYPNWDSVHWTATAKANQYLTKRNRNGSQKTFWAKRIFPTRFIRANGIKMKTFHDNGHIPLHMDVAFLWK